MAMALATSTSYPSYGYMVSNPHEPATSLWEKWEADQLTHDQQDASRNHIMFGSISTFFWEYFAGIIPTTPGWKTIRVAPTFGERCEGTAVFQPRPNDSLGASLATLAGVVEVVWLWQPDMASINVTLPQGTTGATVVVPCVAAGTTVEPLRGGRTDGLESPRVPPWGLQAGSCGPARPLRRPVCYGPRGGPADIRAPQRGETLTPARAF